MRDGRLEKTGHLAVFRADGGPKSGMGHIVRCVALAQAMDVPTVFLSCPDEAVEALVRRAGFEYSAMEEPGCWPLHVARLQPSVVVVDNYAISGSEVALVKEAVPLLVVVDDLNDRNLPADLVINGNITARHLGYAQDKVLLLGPEYALLGAPFRGMPPKGIPEVASNVLITTGGGDPFRVTLAVLQCLLDMNLHIKVACGPQFGAKADLDSLIRNRSSVAAVDLLDNPDMATMMLWADLAVSTGGSTLYELCAAGVPALAMAVAENQVASAQMLGNRGYMIYLGRFADVCGDGGRSGGR